MYMAVLNNNSQVSELALVDLSRSFKPTLDAVAEFQKQLIVDISPIAEAQDNLRKALASAFVFSIADVFKGFAEEQTRMLEMLRESLARAVSINLSDSLISSPSFSRLQSDVLPVYDAEIVEYQPNINMDLELTIEGRFRYQGHLLRTITTNSKHGKLLKLLLTKENNYVTDDEICETLDVSDYRGIGYLRSDLKSALKEAGLQVTLYRENKKGYRLLEVAMLPN